MPQAPQPFTPTVRLVEPMGSVPGVQIAHAGRKGAVRPPREGAVGS